MEFLGFAGATAPRQAGQGRSVGGDGDGIGGDRGGRDGGGATAVGVVRRRALGFPAWALVHDPANARHALDVVKEMERCARLAGVKPGRARAEFEALAERLAASAAHFLPSFFEQAARAFLAADNAAVASALFTRAREVERAYGVAIDEDELAASFLEFALAGAVSAKAMSDYGKQLAGRCAPDEAYRRFRQMCVERVAAGLPPYAAMPSDLRKLARAAKLDDAAEDAAVARDLLALTAVSRAALGFWNLYRPALVRAGKHDVRVLELLVRLMPDFPGSENPVADDAWLELLEQSGALELLAGGGGGGGVGASVGAPRPGVAVDWLNRFVRHAARPSHWRWRSEQAERPRRSRLPGRLVERLAPRLAAEQATGAGKLVLCAWPDADIDLIDQCLAAGLRVAAPTRQFSLNLSAWLASGSPRDLAAFAADRSLRPTLRKAVIALASGKLDRARGQRSLDEVAEQVVACAGLRSVVHDYLAEQAEAAVAGGLADLEVHASFWRRLSNPALYLANLHAVRRVAELDVAAVLGQAIRAGIFDEYGWQALDEACTALAGVEPGADAHLMNLVRPSAASADTASGGRPFYGTYHRVWRAIPQWPYLILSHADAVSVVGAAENVLTCDDAAPRSNPATQSGRNRASVQPNRILRFVDGKLLVAWHAGNTQLAYWHSDPNTLISWSANIEARATPSSLALPDGGRTFGGKPLTYPVPDWSESAPVISDGTSYWTLQQVTPELKNHANHRHLPAQPRPSGAVPTWLGLDPVTGERFSAKPPSFFEGGVNEGEVVAEASWLRPAVPGAHSSPLGCAPDGLLGSRTRRAADGAETCTGTDGRRIVLDRVPANYHVVGALDVPGAGAANRLAILENERQIGWYLADGTRRVAAIQPGAQAAGYSRGTWCMPPVEFWHFLTVRDEAGSVALRRLTDETARTLLDRALNSDLDYEAALVLVRELVPQITDARVAAGVTGYLGVAAACVLQLSDLKERLDTVSSAATEIETEPDTEPETGPEEPSVPTAPALITMDDNLGRTFSRARRGLCGGKQYRGLSLPDAVAGLQDLDRILTGPDAAGSPDKPVRPSARLYQDLPETLWSELVAALLTAPALAYRAVSPALGQAERAALAAFLAALADSALGAPAAGLRFVTLVRADAGAPAAPTWTVTDTPHGRAVVVGREAHRSLKQTAYRYKALDYSRDGQFGEIPGWKVLGERAADPWPNPGGLAEYRRAAEGRDPAPLPAGAAEALSARTGLSRGEAAVLLAALPAQTAGLGDGAPAGLPALLGLKPAELKLAGATFDELGDRTCARLVGALLPARIDQLWADEGPDVDAAAATWIALKGRQEPLPEWLLAAAAKATTSNAATTRETMIRTIRGLLNPDSAAWLGAAQFQAPDIAWSARALLWLCYALPVNDPLRERLPRALAVVRERLADPQLQTEARWARTEPGELAALLGVEAAESGEAWRIGPFSATVNLEWCSLRLHPAALSGPDDPALAYLAGISPGGDDPEALRFLLGEELPALLAAGQVDVSGDPYPAQDPIRSVPQLVAEVADTLTISPDAAAVYLMLLALPDPTDRNQVVWTGWKPARWKAAQSELAATDLVVAGRRKRAGRELFLPGVWNELAAPHLPVETWKSGVLGVRADGTVSLGFAVPRIPVAELYDQAWRRVQAGDGPRLLGLAATRGR
ncbi:MAG TPA: hypothetical protein VGX23_03765 [Actinocrinis sp.]|nr:hypothetical protein [Actinocrinis sp.]